MESVATQRICPWSKRPFTPSRSNQIYENPRNRIAHHNFLVKQARSLREKIFAQILRNHKILCDLVQPDERRTLSLEVLYGKGYVRNACTHIEEFEGDHRIAVCDFIIVNIDRTKDAITIYRKKQEDGQR